MPQPTNLYDKYDAVGIREALSDAIYNISPEETPFMANAGRETTKNTKFEWQTDALAAASTTNYAIEGDDSVLEAQTPTARLDNQTQISKKIYGVSGTIEATDRAGRASELSYLAAKASAEIKRDMESMALANNAKVAGNSSTARETASFLAYLGTNTVFQTGGTPSGADPVTLDGAAARTDNSAVAAFTETMLKTVAQSIWNNGGKLKMLMVGAHVKTVVSGFPGIAAQRHMAAGNKPTTIIGAADVYVTDFGNLSIVPNRFQRGRDALFVDPEYVSFVYLRPFTTEKLAKTGDSEKRHLLVEWGLKVKTELAHGGAFDLATS